MKYNAYKKLLMKLMLKDLLVKMHVVADMILMYIFTEEEVPISVEKKLH